MIFKTEKDRHNAHHNVFSSNEGRRVLVDILGTLGFWDTGPLTGLTESEQGVLNRHAKKLLERCGFWRPENYEAIVMAFMGIRKPPKKSFWKRLFERKRK